MKLTLQNSSILKNGNLPQVTKIANEVTVRFRVSV
jgi:hypothetical protein